MRHMDLGAAAATTFGPLELRPQGVVLDTAEAGAVTFSGAGLRIKAGGESLEAPWADVAQLTVVSPVVARWANGPLAALGLLFWPVRTGIYDVVVTRWSAPQQSFRLEPGGRAPYDYPSVLVVEALIDQLAESGRLSRLGDVDWVTRFLAVAPACRSWRAGRATRMVRRALRELG